jgi:prophage regulatory protein
MADHSQLIPLVRALAALIEEEDYQRSREAGPENRESLIFETAPPQRDRYLRRTEVEKLTGLSRSSIYRHISNGAFPRPFALTRRSVRWRESELIGWMGQHERT